MRYLKVSRFFRDKRSDANFCSFGYKLIPLRIRRVINRIMYLESVSWKPRSKDWNLLLEAAIWYKDILLTLWRFELALTQTTITCLRRLWAGRTNVKVFTHEIGSMYNSSKHVFRRRQWWKGSSYWKNCNLFLNGFGKVLKKEGFLSIETTGTWNLSL